MKLPYGQSNFKNVATDGFYYVDRTMYIEQLERQANRFLFYLRPRKFGKSLFISMLEHYYDERFKAQFQDIFGKCHIGRKPTALANSYLLLVFDFSGISTDTKAQVLHSFTLSVKTSIEQFFSNYLPGVAEKERALIEKETLPANVLKRFFTIIQRELPGKKVYILIDEYDHFANELIAFNLAYFKEIVSRNGFVRKFYEVIKLFGRIGLVERMFATGVSPVTLDSLTSGFNIGEKLTTDLEMHNMMGFTESETAEILAFVGAAPDSLPQVMDDLRHWYDGYRFNPDAAVSLYNPSMVIYFANHYSRYGKYPEKLLDENIASDYGKMKLLLGVGGEPYSLEILEEVLAKGHIRATLTTLYTFELNWVRDDYASLLFYLGMLTVQGRIGPFWTFAVPNQVIRNLYYDFFVETLRLRADIRENLYTEIGDAIHALSMENELQPLVRIVEKILSRLSGRDVQHFGESHLQVIMAALLSSAQAWLVRSQPEVERRFVDILCTRLPQIPIRYSFAFELKYLKKEEAGQLQSKAREAREQLEGYLRSEELRHLPDLRAYAIVFVGTEARSVVPVK